LGRPPIPNQTERYDRHSAVIIPLKANDGVLDPGLGCTKAPERGRVQCPNDFRTFPRMSILSLEEPDIVCVSRSVVHVTTRPPEFGYNPAEAKYWPRPRRSDGWISLIGTRKTGRRADGRPDVPSDRRRPA
jgi:hypothetical protein